MLGLGEGNSGVGRKKALGSGWEALGLGGGSARVGRRKLLDWEELWPWGMLWDWRVKL